jgi:CheY-like chemotaxis protein/predicted regulator of Ras-like GTPase activity (Roadblock/LC7/MglB family)
MPKVLVVDDSLSVRKVVQRALEAKRIEVLSAASGTEAMEQIARETPDLVVCDVIMPDMDGYQICDFVKKHPALGRTPVILISGIVNSTVLERAAKVGSDDVMRKPFAADELLHRIEGFLPAQARPAASAPAAAAVATAPVLAPAVEVPTPAPSPAAPAAAPVVRPPVVVEPLPDIKPLLSGVADLPGVTLTALIDREGALMEAAGSLLPEAMLAGALAACLVESTDGVGRALAQGQLQSVILEYDGGVVLLNAVGPGAMLAVVLDDPAVLGKVRYHVKKALPDLVRAV